MEGGGNKMTTEASPTTTKTHTRSLSNGAEVSESPMAPVSKMKDWLSDFESKNKKHSEQTRIIGPKPKRSGLDVNLSSKSVSSVSSEGQQPIGSSTTTHGGEVSETPVLPVSKMTGWLANLEQKNKEQANRNNVKLSLQKRRADQNNITEEKKEKLSTLSSSSSLSSSNDIDTSRVEVSNSPMAPVSKMKDWLTNFEQKNKEHYKKSQIKGANRRGTSTDPKTPAKKQIGVGTNGSVVVSSNVKKFQPRKLDVEPRNSQTTICNAVAPSNILTTPAPPKPTNNNNNNVSISISPVRPVSERKDWLVKFEQQNKEHFQKNQVKRSAVKPSRRNIKAGKYMDLANKSMDLPSFHRMDSGSVREIEIEEEEEKEKVYDFCSLEPAAQSDAENGSIPEEEEEKEVAYLASQACDFSVTHSTSSSFKTSGYEGENESIKQEDVNLASQAADFSIDQSSSQYGPMDSESVKKDDDQVDTHDKEEDSEEDTVLAVLENQNNVVVVEKEEEEYDDNFRTTTTTTTTSSMASSNHSLEELLQSDSEKEESVTSSFVGGSFSDCETTTKDGSGIFDAINCASTSEKKRENVDELVETVVKENKDKFSSMESKTDSETDGISSSSSSSSSKEGEPVLSNKGSEESNMESAMNAISISSIEHEGSERERPSISPSIEASNEDAKTFTFNGVNDDNKEGIEGPKRYSEPSRIIPEKASHDDVVVVDDEEGKNHHREIVFDVRAQSITSPISFDKLAFEAESNHDGKKKKMNGKKIQFGLSSLKSKKHNKKEKKEKSKKANKKKSIMNKFSGRMKKNGGKSSNDELLVMKKSTSTDSEECLSPPQCKKASSADAGGNGDAQPLLAATDTFSSVESLSPMTSPAHHHPRRESPYFVLPKMKQQTLSLQEMAKDTKSCFLAKQDKHKSCTDLVLFQQRDIVPHGKEEEEGVSSPTKVEDSENNGGEYVGSSHVMWLQHQFPAAKRSSTSRRELRYNSNSTNNNGGKKKFLSPRIRKAISRIGEIASPLKSSSNTLLLESGGGGSAQQQARRLSAKSTPQKRISTSVVDDKENDASLAQKREDGSSIQLLNFELAA